MFQFLTDELSVGLNKWKIVFVLFSISFLVTCLVGDAYLVDVNPSSSYGGTIAREVGAAFSAMMAGRKNPVSLLALKGKVGEFHHQFSGSEQNGSHDFLMYLLAWLHEDLRGGSLPACLGGGLTSHHVAAAGSNSKLSIITILFQSMHKNVISCGNCQHESVSFEPFTILSLAFPVSGNSMLKRLLRNYYEDTFITYMPIVQQGRRKLKENNHPEDATDTRSSLKPIWACHFCQKETEFCGFPSGGSEPEGTYTKWQTFGLIQSVCGVKPLWYSEWWTLYQLL